MKILVVVPRVYDLALGTLAVIYVQMYSADSGL